MGHCCGFTNILKVIAEGVLLLYQNKLAPSIFSSTHSFRAEGEPNGASIRQILLPTRITQLYVSKNLLSLPKVIVGSLLSNIMISLLSNMAHVGSQVDRNTHRRLVNCELLSGVLACLDKVQIIAMILEFTIKLF